MYPNTMPQPPTPPHHQPPGAPRPPVQPARPGLRQVPVPFWIGLVVGAAAFVVHLSFQQTYSSAENYRCTYTDVAGYLAAVAIGVCIVAGWISRAAARRNGRLAVPLMLAFTVALLALGVVHALRGNGDIMSPCDSTPRA